MCVGRFRMGNPEILITYVILLVERYMTLHLE